MPHPDQLAGASIVPGPRSAPATRPQSVIAALLHPERVLDAARELLRGDRAAGCFLAAAELAVQARHAPAGVDAVPLHLDQRDRSLCRRAVQMGNAVVRVLPALVLQPARRLALVLDEAVAVLVSILVDPAQRRLRGGEQLLGGLPVVGPL